MVVKEPWSVVDASWESFCRSEGVVNKVDPEKEITTCEERKQEIDMF